MAMALALAMALAMAMAMALAMALALAMAMALAMALAMAMALALNDNNLIGSRRMSVHYTRGQRRTAKAKDFGLITISVTQPGVGTTTVQGPASKEAIESGNKSVGELLKVWTKENN